MRNGISGPLDEGKHHIGNGINMRWLKTIFFTGPLEHSEALMSIVAIIFKNFQKMRFFSSK